ncbi:hypothetical protein R0J87_19810, partial [Halomonas sp. SIMBA_159]
IRTAAGTTFVAGGDVVFDDESIDHTGGEADANYAGTLGGSFTFATGSTYNTLGGRPSINAIDGASLTFETGVLNLGDTDRWTLNGDGTGTVTV